MSHINTEDSSPTVDPSFGNVGVSTFSKVSTNLGKAFGRIWIQITNYAAHHKLALTGGSLAAGGTATAAFFSISSDQPTLPTDSPLVKPHIIKAGFEATSPQIMMTAVLISALGLLASYGMPSIHTATTTQLSTIALLSTLLVAGAAYGINY